MDTRERILRKIGSWPITHWVMRKVVVGLSRRMHKAPEVQKCIEALRATAPNTVEQVQAFLAYHMALQKELEKSRFGAWPPGSAQIGEMLQKMESGTATTSEIEEFRRLAEEVMRHPRCSPGFRKRIESALRGNDSHFPPQNSSDGKESDAVRSFSRSCKTSGVPVSLADCLDDLSKWWFEAFQGKGVRFEANIDPSIPTFCFDYEKVQQVAANLLDNALNHTPSGGSVTLNCIMRPNGVEVSLTGALEDDQKILDDYEAVSLSRAQTYEESLAIGLTIAKRLVLAHHGKIWVEASSTGSKFVFVLPTNAS